MPKNIKVNVLGDTQRQQWHTVVGLLRWHLNDGQHDHLKGILDELDRYIDHAEDIFDDIRKEQGEEE